MGGFRSLPARAARWQPEEGIGLEHVSLGPGPTGFLIRGTVIGERGGIPYGVFYRLSCDEAWRTRSLILKATSGRSIDIHSDGQGHWHEADGRPLDNLDGAIDIDLAGSAFTNTLPIRRLKLAEGECSGELTMAYVPFDTFKPARDHQIYTCLERGSLYRYEAADRSFTAELPVDEDGLVRDYPTLFRRIPVDIP
ncbi:putative glycolipid-binding domain-containing protein [Afifella aestuarii]|uniref:putative glycolipid-binding domain-containing protein n=1 Tax=Afifella aestuarii TaxID=1909496 RepID=UPI000FE43838|nr:putative glycolipid-binding domain-containing protein [Afifella aestuarii]